MPEDERTDRMDHVADVFVDEFRNWALFMGTRNARLHLSGYVGNTLVFVYEPWPDGVPGLLIGDFLDDDWDAEESVVGLFTVPMVEMFEPGGTRNFTSPAQVDRSLIHWGAPAPFAQGLPRTPEQLRSGVVPPGFVSRLPAPWPGPAPAPSRQPRPPLKTMLAGLAEFAVVSLLFPVHRSRDD